MPIDLADYEKKVEEAVRRFWRTRGARDTAGNRAAVVGGKNLQGFAELLMDIVTANGLNEEDVRIQSGDLHLPGFYRASKQWDLLVLHRECLIAVFELKSQVGPSFGNNFNNRCEEAIGSATDLWTAFREGAFRDSPRPFLGYLMLLEDCEKSRTPVRIFDPHFEAFPEFQGASYSKRYKLLCEKLVNEGLYEAATLILSPVSAAESGQYREYGLRAFVAEFAAHIAARTARQEI